MMILKILTRKTVMSTWKSTVRPVKSEKRMTAVLALIHWIHSGRMKLAPLAPFITRK